MILVSIFCFLYVLFAVNSENVDVITTFGTIRGIKTVLNDGKNVVYQFCKIPYAEPPVGKYRFQKPLPHPPLSGIYDATEFGPSCMQMVPILSLNATQGPMSEDCLHLNIYVPNSIVSIPRAVMLWIHGGGFQTGKGSDYNGLNLATTGDVIVVTINYRLDLFGFMNTDDDMYRGNYGLFDQLEAIKWTKKHINSFGGDPNKITIFGESAGAFSVAMLSSSPLSKGLFQRAIMESGGDFTKKNVERDLRNVSIQAMQILECINDTRITKETMKCMIQANGSDIINASRTLFATPDEILPITRHLVGPCIDGELIPAVPEILLRNLSSDSSKVFNSIDVMAGINSADGGVVIFAMDFYKTANITWANGISTDVFCQDLVSSIVDQHFYSDSTVKKIMCGLYTDVGGMIDQARSTVDWFRDLVFGYPMSQILNFHAKASTKQTYQYLFSKEPTKRAFPVPKWFQGANHGEEIAFVFGLLPNTKNGNERYLSEKMMRYWTNFAKTGQPNTGEDDDHFWPPYTSGQAYMEFGDQIKPHHDLYANRFQFWLETIPRILAQHGHPVPD